MSILDHNKARDLADAQCSKMGDPEPLVSWCEANEAALEAQAQAALRPLVGAVREWQEAFKKYDKNCTLSGFQRLESAEQALSALALPEAK